MSKNKYCVEHKVDIYNTHLFVIAAATAGGGKTGLCVYFKLKKTIIDIQKRYFLDMNL